MKTILKSLVPLAIALLVGCSKKDTAPSPMNCANNTTRFTETLTAYAANPTEANCKAYKKAITDYVKSCGGLFTAEDKKEWDEFLAEPCS